MRTEREKAFDEAKIISAFIVLGFNKAVIYTVVHDYYVDNEPVLMNMQRIIRALVSGAYLK